MIRLITGVAVDGYIAFGNLFFDADCDDQQALTSSDVELIDFVAQHLELMIVGIVAAPTVVEFDLEIVRHTVLNFVDVMPLVALWLQQKRQGFVKNLHSEIQVSYFEFRCP